MKTTATVISCQGERAVVEAKRTAACEGCHKMADGGCSVCSLVGGEGKPFSATAENRIGAEVGDVVAIESPTSRMLLYAALVFLLPLLLCFFGWLIASCITQQPQWQAAGALAGLVLSFLGLRIYSASVHSKRTDVIITEIIAKHSN